MRVSRETWSLVRVLFLSVALVGLAACSGGDDDGDGPGSTGVDAGSDAGSDAGTDAGSDAGSDAGAHALPPEQPPTAPVTTVNDQLRELGINVSGIQGQPRRLDSQLSVQGDWAPLGMRARLAPMELVGAGIGDDCADLDDSTPNTPGPRTVAIEIWDEAVDRVQPAKECHRIETGNVTGSDPDSSRAQPGTLSTRTLVSGDFDGDGLDEGGTLRFRPVTNGDGTTTWWLRSARIKHGARGTFASLVGDRPVGTLPVRDSDAVGGDVDGDGSDDVVVGLLKDSYFALIAYPQIAPGQFDERGGLNQVDLAAPAGTRSLVMTAGNLDLDPALETVVVLRTLQAGTAGGPPTGEVRYWVYDNLPLTATGNARYTFPLLASGTLTYTDPTTQATRPWLTADAVVGDLDGDGLGELAFTGIGAFPASEGCDPYTYVTRVLDDRAHGAGVMATRVETASSPACTSTSDPGILYEVYAQALDYDGDYTRELLANERLLALRSLDTGGWTLEPKRVGSTQTLVDFKDLIPSRPSEHVSEATFAFAVGDVNNDGRQDVLAYSAYDSVLRMRGMGGFTSQLGFNSSAGSTYPLLAPFDSDLDGSTVVYVPGSHRVELTEPVIHAVLAAPPYQPEFGQEPLDATSSYGRSTSSGSSSETTLSFNVSASFGLKAGASVGPLEFSVEAKTTLDTWVDETTGTAYTTTFTDTYQTAGRDAVVFTSFPYDLYDYRIVASDKAALIGQTMVIMLPRTPVTRIVSREYFNARVPDGHLRIDERVLKHTPGNVRSYMTWAERGELKGRVQGGAFGSPLFLESARKTVGQGTTSTTTEIELSQENFHTQAVGVSRSYGVALTAGVAVAEFSVGSGEENSVTVSAGQSTLVSSTVPSITVDDTAQPNAVYDWGMVTYMQRLSPTGTSSGQVFQVVNFWVE